MPEHLTEHSAPSYERLSQVHPEYDESVLREYWALYKGGQTLLKDQRLVARMIPSEMGEHPQRYNERLRRATYINHFGKIVGFFCSAIFQQQVQVLEDGDTEKTDDYYENFQKNADGKGNHLTFSLRKALVSAMVCKRGVLVVDFPLQGKSDSLLSQRERGGAALPYLVHRDTTDLINWKEANDGTFEWCVFKRLIFRQSGPMDKPKLVEEFKIWTLDPITKRAAWAIYETNPVSVDSDEANQFENAKIHNKQAGISQALRQVDAGLTDFRRVPVLVLDIEDDLWVGDRVAPLAKEHFQRRTALRTAISKHLFSIPFVKLGAEIPEAGGGISAAQGDENRGVTLKQQLEGKGFVVLGADDDVGFAEPKGTAYQLEAQQEQELIDEMYRVGEQMSNSIAMTSSGVYRSGISKAEDRYGTELVLETYASRVRWFAKAIMDTIAQARGETVAWEARGAEDFSLWDRNTTLGEAVNVDKVSIPSKSFHVTYKTQVASRLIKDPTPELVSLIRDEIEADIEENGVPDPRRERMEQQEAQLDAQKDREKGPVTTGQIIGDSTKPTSTKVSKPST